MNKNNKKRWLEQSLSIQEKKIVADRSSELFLLGLDGFSSLSDISSVARHITDTLTAFDVADYEYRAMWRFLCLQTGKQVQLPFNKNIYKSVKRMLVKFVDNAGFVLQSIQGHDDHYISDDYYGHIKRLKHSQPGSSSFYLAYMYSRSDNKKQFMRASGQYTRVCGLASLAQKDGLKPYFLTITLKPEFHRSSRVWNGMTPEQSTRLLTKRWSKLVEALRNNKIRAEMIRNIDPQTDGTPHLHATVFTDDPENFERLLTRLFVDNDGVVSDGPHGIKFEETDNPYQAILYTIKTLWPSNDNSNVDEWERIRAWKERVQARCFSISTNVRTLPPVALFDSFRKLKFEARHEIAAVKKLASRIHFNWLDMPNGDSFIYMHNTYHANGDDALAETYSKLTMSATDGDFANFTRIFNAATNTRKRSPVCKKVGLETSGSLGAVEVAQITELRTIRQVIRKFDHKIRDVQDWKWLLHHKYIGAITPIKAKAVKKAENFMEHLRESLISGTQTELRFT